MKWLNKNNPKNFKLPDVEDISKEIPAISEYLEAFRLPELYHLADIDTLPVIDTKGKITGIVSEYDLTQILPEWSLEEHSYMLNIKVSDIMTKKVWVEEENTNIKDLFANIHNMHTRVIPIVDKYGIYTGKCITRQALVSFLTGMVKPRSIGGLATPIGVYLTDGKHQAGAGNLGLLLTGFSLGAIAFIAEKITAYLLGQYLSEIFLIIIQLLLFILILRQTPLVKYHAAEHQTIHAIEKGLPLTLETVKMQPRSHKRCGTNIMVLLLGIQFVLLISFNFNKTPIIQFIILVTGFLFVFSHWQKAGMWLQEFFTTKCASRIQLENGIKVGEEILKKHKEDTSPYPPAWTSKLWNMGLIQILSGFLFIIWLFNFLLHIVIKYLL